MVYAVNKIGAIANMVHPLSSESEIAFCLKESASVVCLTLDQFYGKFANIRKEVPLRSLIITSIKDVLSPVKRKGYYLAEGRKIKKVPANMVGKIPQRRHELPWTISSGKERRRSGSYPL